MSPLVPVLYACVRLSIVPFCEDIGCTCDPKVSDVVAGEAKPVNWFCACDSRLDAYEHGCVFPNGKPETTVKHELRSKLDDWTPPECCMWDMVLTPGVASECKCSRPGFTDGDWQCKPILEFEGKP